MKTIKKNNLHAIIEVLTKAQVYYDADLVLEFAQEVETDESLPQEIDGNVLILGYLEWIGGGIVNVTIDCDKNEMPWVNSPFIYYILIVSFPDEHELVQEYAEEVGIDGDGYEWMDMTRATVKQDYLLFKKTKAN